MISSPLFSTRPREVTDRRPSTGFVDDPLALADDAAVALIDDSGNEMVS